MLDQLLHAIDDAGLWQENIQLQRKEFLTVKGATDRRLYFVISGSLRVYFEDEYEEQIVRLGYTGNLLAALDSFLSGEPTDFYIQALKSCELKATSRDLLYELIGQRPELSQIWQVVMEQLIYQQLEREKDILTYSPRRRYERVLERSPHLFQEIPHKYIASYLRMTPETLSRLKKS